MKQLADGDSLLIGLNPEQKQAVLHKGGPALVIAGAGTGKTKVITTRIAHLIATGEAAPEEILALTFTDKAAQEMQNRVDELLPYGYVETRIMTFHALGAELIKDYALDMQIHLAPKLATTFQQYVFMEAILEELPNLKHFRPAHDPRQYIGLVLHYFSRLKDEGLGPDDFAAWLKSFTASLDAAKSADIDIERYVELSQLYTAYEGRKQTAGFIDFGDQLLLPYKLMSKKQRIAQKIQSQYKYILVDEFQDTNIVQANLLHILSKKHQNLMVVGDDDQSIYQFRGAALENILKFDEIYSQATKIVLTENYRSTQVIVDAAYELIQQNNPERLEAKLMIPKQLHAQREGEPPQLIVSETSQTELAGVVGSVRAGIDRYGVNEVAVLTRNNSQAEAVMQALAHAGIGVATQVRLSLFLQPVVRQCVDFVRLLHDTHDSQALYRYLIGPTVLADISVVTELAAHAKRLRISLTEAIRKSEEADTDQIAYIYAQIQLIESYRTAASQQSAGELLYEFVSNNDFLNNLVARSSEDATAARAIHALAKFFTLIHELEAVEQIRSSHELWHHIERMFELEIMLEPDEMEQSDGVQVLTVHRAKGLEFEQVILYDVIDGAYPAMRRSEPLLLPQQMMANMQADTNNPSLQHRAEERRLFYVAITRAKSELIVTYSTDHGGKRLKKPSPFLLEAFGHVSQAMPTVVSAKLAAIERFAPTKQTIAEPTFPETDGWLHLSPNQIADYDRDPASFYLRHVLRFPERPSHRLVYGTAIHAGLETYMRLRQSGQPVDLELIIAAYHQAWSHLGFVSQRHEKERLRAGEQTLRRVVTDYEADNELKIVAIEQSFDLSLEDIKVRIRGRYDLVLGHGDGVEIRDFKTSQVSNQRTANDKLRDAVPMQVYALAWQLSQELPVTAISLQFVDAQLLALRERFDHDKTMKKIQHISEGIRARQYPSKDYRINYETEGLQSA